MVYENLARTILEGGGEIIPILIDPKDSKGTGLCNASILYTNGKLYMILRNVEYTLHICEGEKKYQSCNAGPLCYYHRDDELSLRTVNFLCELNPDTLRVERSSQIDTRKFDTPPLWAFIGLEDARLVYWNNTFYACGVRRDTTTNGQGRMEFSELKITDSSGVEEIARTRIQVQDSSSYCEKNWMPIKDKPNYFVKWSNPTEIVKVDLKKKFAERVYQSQTQIPLPFDLRGGSHLIPWDDGTYLSIVHECDFILKNINGQKDSDYYHRFVIWNSDWTIRYISIPFNFMTGRIEFCIGLEQIDDNIIIVFGFHDNCTFALRMKKKFFDEIIWKTLQN